MRTVRRAAGWSAGRQVGRSAPSWAGLVWRRRRPRSARRRAKRAAATSSAAPSAAASKSGVVVRSSVARSRRGAVRRRRVAGFPDGACCDETVEGDFFGICCNLQGPNLTGCCTADFRHCCPDEPGLPACCETGFPVCCPPLAPDLPDGYCCREGFTCGTTADEPCVPESGLRGATAERGEPGKRRGKSTPVHSPDQADAS